MAKQPLVGLIREKKKTCLEKNILLPLVCCVVETCWELPGPLCSAVLLSKGGSCPSPGCVLGIAERFCCSADYQKVTQHYCQECPFLGDNKCFPQAPLPSASKGLVVTGNWNPLCCAHSSQESCLPWLFQLPGILLPIASLQLLASVTTNRSSHPSASVSPAVWGH